MKGGTIMDFNLIDFIKENYIIIAVVLYVVGVLLKQSKVKDNYIPIILVLIGILLAVLVSFPMIFAQATIAEQVKVMTDAVIQGILCAGLAVLGNQLYKQLYEPKR